MLKIKQPKPQGALLKDYELACLRGLSVDTIRRDRYRDRAIPFIKFGSGIWYDLKAVDAALEKMTVGGGS